MSTISRHCFIFLSIWINIGYGDNVNTKASYKELATIINQFTFDFLKQTDIKHDQFFSPVSIHSAFSMLALGARGKSLDQLKKALHLPEKDERRHFQSYSDLNNKLTSNENVTVASKLLGDKSIKFLKKFIHDSLKYFGAEVEILNFSQKKESAQDINNWVSNQTKGKIKEIVTEEDFDPNTRLFLVNAINFQGRWKYEFNPNLTEEMDFWMSETESKKVPMMYMEKTKLKHAMVESLGCTALELPYDGEELSMTILLPDSRQVPMEEIRQNITTNVLDSIDFSIEDVQLIMPRFKIETKYRLTNIFRKLQVEDIFSPGKSDLLGIDGTQNLYVSKALHKAYIEVNEEGTEASAVTSIGVKTRKALHILVNVDHPFFFIIRENTSGVILFVGQIINLQNTSNV